MQVYRLLIPTYEERAELICQFSYQRMYATFSSPVGKMVGIDNNNVHPFMAGSFPGSLNGDSGDMHCRIVAENREKYPMPEHKMWESMGPIATADMIKYTPEEDMVSDPQYLREECDYKFCNGTCAEYDAAGWFRPNGSAGGAAYFWPLFDSLIKSGRITEEDLDRAVHCVMEAAGKAQFGGFYAIDGVRSWLGVPPEIKDGRVMGGFLEVYLACQGVPVEVEAQQRGSHFADQPRRSGPADAEAVAGLSGLLVRHDQDPGQRGICPVGRTGGECCRSAPGEDCQEDR